MEELQNLSEKIELSTTLELGIFQSSREYFCFKNPTYL